MHYMRELRIYAEAEKLWSAVMQVTQDMQELGSYTGYAMRA